MLTQEELSGIVEVLVLLSEDEIMDIAHELAFMRDEDTPQLDDVRHLIKSAQKSHWLESVPNTAACNNSKGSDFYIAGPSSFGIVPGELSEIMEILEFEGCRSFDWETVTSKIIKDMSLKVEKLEALVEDVAEGFVVIEKAEAEYSDYFNLYYDYDFWLPGGLPIIGEKLEKISRRLKELKEEYQKE